MKLKYIATLLFAVAAFSISAQGYKDGVEFYKAQRFNQAKVLLERNLNKPGTDKAASYYYLGMIEMQVENPDKDAARKFFEQGIAANPKYPYNYVGMGLLDLMGHDAKAAENNFKLAEKNAGKDQSSVEVAIARAFYRIDPNIYAKEITKRLAKAYKKDAENPDYFLFLADQAADNKQWGDANGNFEMAYGYEPTSSEAYVRYADILKVRNPKESIRVLQLLLSQNPQSALGQRELARTYYDNNMYKEAAEQYGKYVQNPNHFDEDEAEYSFLLFVDGRYQDGYNYANQLLTQNPNNYSAERFQLMNAAQLPELAEKMLPMAKKLWADHNADPQMKPFAQIDYALVADQFAKAKDYPTAELVLAEAIKQFPQASQYDRQLSFAYLDQDKMKEATAAWNAYINKTKEPSASDYRTAMIFNYSMAAQLKDSIPAESSQYLQTLNTYIANAEKSFPADPTPYFFQGREKILMASAMESTKVAIPDFEKAMQLVNAAADKKPYINNAMIMLDYLAKAALAAGNKAQAAEYYNQGLALSPDDAGFKAALSKIK